MVRKLMYDTYIDSFTIKTTNNCVKKPHMMHKYFAYARFLLKIIPYKCYFLHLRNQEKNVFELFNGFE